MHFLLAFCPTTKSESTLPLHKDGQFYQNTEVVYWIRRKNLRNPLRLWAPLKLAPSCYSSAGWIDCGVLFGSHYQRILQTVFKVNLLCDNGFKWSLLLSFGNYIKKDRTGDAKVTNWPCSLSGLTQQSFLTFSLYASKTGKPRALLWKVTQVLWAPP